MKTNWFQKFKTTIVLSLLLVTSLAVACCAGLGRAIEASSEQRQNYIDTTQQQIDQQRENAKLVGVTDPAKAEAMNKEADKAQKGLDLVKTGQATLVVDPSTGEIDREKTAEKILALVPFPYNLIGYGILGAWGIFAEYRSKNNKDAAVSIVKSVDTVIRNAPGGKQTFKEMPDGVRSQVREDLTPHAKKLIDEVSTT